MRDYAPDNQKAAGSTEPRGAEALQLSPIGRKAGLTYELARGPMQSRFITVAAYLTSRALTVVVCSVLVLAVWVGLGG